MVNESSVDENIILGPEGSKPPQSREEGGGEEVPEVDPNRKRIFYIFSGNSTQYTLFLDDGNSNEAISCDNFKRAVCRANHFAMGLVPRLTLYKFHTRDALTEYRRAETISHGSTVLLSLGHEGSVSATLKDILPLLTSSSKSISLPYDVIKKTLTGIDPSLDPLLFRESVLPRDIFVGPFSAETDCSVIQGLISASIDEFKAGKECPLAGVVRVLALATQNPRNAEMFTSFPKMLDLCAEALKCLIDGYSRFLRPGIVGNNGELLNETSIGNAIGYSFQIFVNMTRVHYSWCSHRKMDAKNANNSTNDNNNVASTTAAISREGVPESIARFVELLEQKIHSNVDSPVPFALFVLGIETIGAISYNSLQVLTSLGSRKSFLNSLILMQRFKVAFGPNVSDPEKFKMLEFRARQAAFNFLVMGSRGSPAFSKEASVAGSLDAIVGTLFWTTATFYHGEAELDEFNPVLACDEYFATSSHNVFCSSDDMSPTGRLMSVLGDALAGGTTYSQWLMNGLLAKLFNRNCSDENACKARAVYTKFPELQYRFIECLSLLIETTPPGRKVDVVANDGEKDDDSAVVSNSNSNNDDDNDKGIKDVKSDASDENEKYRKKMSNKSSLVADNRLWELLFSEDFMEIGSERCEAGTIKLSTRKFFVCLRKKIFDFIVKLSDNNEVSFITLTKLYRKCHNATCAEVRVICLEIMGAVTAKSSSNPDIIADTDSIVATMCVALSMLSCSITTPTVSLGDDPTFKSLLVRYKSSRSVIVASITSIIDLKNANINRQLLIEKDVVNAFFNLLGDSDIGTFALNEIMRLFSVAPDRENPQIPVQEDLEKLAERCVRYVEAFSGTSSTEQEFYLEITFLQEICRVCQMKRDLQLLFINSGIFFALLTLLTIQMPHFPERKAALLDQCLCTLYCMFLSNPAAKHKFESNVGYESLKVTLYSFSEYVDQTRVLDRLFEIAVESRHAWNEAVPPMIQNPRMLLFICEFLPVLSYESMKYAVGKIRILVNSPPNRSICCKNGVLTALLEVISSSNLRTDGENGVDGNVNGNGENIEIPSIDGNGENIENSGNAEGDGSGKVLALKRVIPFDPEITPQIIDIIEVLGSYMLSASELKRIIYILSLSGPSETRLPEFPYLVNALRKMPSQRFVLPSLEGDLFAKGFTFCVWIYFESTERLSSKKSGKNYSPVIFSFTGEKQRLELRVRNASLLLKIQSPTGYLKQQKDSSETVETIEFSNYKIPERKWFLLSLTIVPGLINSEARVYFGNELKDKTLLKYPRLPRLTRNELGRGDDPSDTLSSSGSSSSSSNSNDSDEGTDNIKNFIGNMGNVSIFGEALTQNQIRSIYNAGPNYLGTFREQEFYVDGAFIHSRSLLFSYSARAQRNGTNILNLAVIDDVDDKRVLWSAAKTKDVETSSITTINDVISSAEGVFVLFPIIPMLNNPPHPDYKSPYSDKELLIFIMELINKIILGSPELENVMTETHGYAIISHILKKIPAACLSPSLVTVLDKVYRVSAFNEKFQASLLKDLLLDFTLWVYAPSDTQQELIRVLKEYVRSRQHREYITAASAFNVLRLFYWTPSDGSPPKKWELCSEPRMGVQTNEVIATRPPPEKIRDIRRELYELIRVRFAGEGAVVPEDIDALINFLSGYYDPDMITDILKSLCGTLFGGNAKSTAETFVTKGGLVELILAFERPSVRLQVASVEMITRLNDIMLESNLRHARLDVISALVRQKLSSQKDPIPMQVCNSLFRMSVRLDSAVGSVLVFPSVLVLCLFPLLAVDGVSFEVRNAVFKDFSELLASPQNAEKFLQCPNWEYPLATLVEKYAEDCAKNMFTPTAARSLASILFSLSEYSVINKNYGQQVEVFFALLRAAESRLVNKDFFLSYRSLYFMTLSRSFVSMKKSTEYFSYALMFVFYAINSLVYMEDSSPEYALQDAEALVNFVSFFDKSSVTLSPNWAGYERWKSSGTQFLRTRPGGFLSESMVVILRALDLLSVVVSRSPPSGNSPVVLKKIQSIVDVSMTHLRAFADLLLPRLLGPFQPEYYHLLLRAIEIYGKFPQGSPPEIALNGFIGEIAAKACEKKRLKKFLPEGILGTFQLFASNWSTDKKAALAEPGWELVSTELKKRAQPFEASVIAANYKEVGLYFKKLVGEDAPAAALVAAEATAVLQSANAGGVDDDSRRRCESEEARLTELAQKIRVQSAEGAHEWRNLMRALTAGNGPWGTAEAFPNWKLDKTENLSRMRLKLKRNYAFNTQDKKSSSLCDSDNLPLTPPMSPSMLPSLPSSPSLSFSGFSSSHRRSMLTANWLGLLNAIPVKKAIASDLASGDGNNPSNSVSESINSNNNEEEEDGSNEKEDLKNDEVVNAAGKSVIYSRECQLISPGRIVKGKLYVVSQSGVQFLENVDESAAGAAVRRRKKVFWASGNIKEVHTRRYLLAYTALEIFFYDCTNVFIDFEDNSAMKAAYNKITKGLKPPRLIIANNRSPMVTLQNSGLTEAWVNGEISNFDYLMALNTIAGRTYNDLRQYPVFPWIIADYESETLDLKNPKTFRDLSKPIGALTEKRLNEIRERYEHLKRMSQELPDDENNEPPFMYGTHYSSPDVVFFFMIRVEPFTNNFLELNDSRLDVPDRMFHSIKVAWANCLCSTGDIKELIPEFFYFPDFLQNLNNYNFGKLQTGVPIGDVELPPWAHGSPEEFVRLNREALESPYVSAHLHEWIDLIFGYKQRGEEAVKADNLFRHFTYEGAVDITKVSDERSRTILRDLIANFGQTPSQLLTTPHPKRNFVPRRSVWLEAAGITSPTSLAMSSTNLLKSLSATMFTSGICTKWSTTVSLDKSPLVYAVPVDGRIITVSASRVLCAHGFTGLDPAAAAAALPPPSSSSLNQSSRIILTSSNGGNGNANHPPFTLTTNNKNSNGSPFKAFGTCFDEKVATANSSQLFSASESGKILFTCGFWDGSFKVVSVDTREIAVSIREHKGIVTCLKYTRQSGTLPEAGTLVTGSTDTTVMTWSTVIANESFNLSKQPLHVLYGHNDEITALDASSDFDIVASGDKSGCLVVHTLRRGGFVWSALIPKAGSISSVKISAANGHVYAYSRECSVLAAFDINGRLLGVAEKCGDIVSDFCVTNDGKTLFSCHPLYPYIWIWDAASLTVVQKVRLEFPAICVSVSKDDVLIIAGLTNGSLLVISPKDVRTKIKLP